MSDQPLPDRHPLGHNPLVFCRSWVGWGQEYGLGSVFNKKYPPGSAQCPAAAENNGGYDLPSSTAYNVEPVTNSSSSSCANNERRTPRCARRSPPSVAALFFTLRDSYGWQQCRPIYAAKPDIRPESCFLPTSPAFDAPVRGVPVGISPPHLVWKKLEWRGYPMVKKFRKYVYSFSHDPRTWQTDKTDWRTDRHCMTA